MRDEGDTQHITEPTAVPEQAIPAHDAIAPDHVPAALVGPPAVVPTSAHWEKRKSPQFLAGFLLLFAWLGFVFFTTMAILQTSGAYAAGAVGCLATMVLIRGVLMSAGLTIVDLRGSQLTVHRDGYVDTVDLASSYTIAELTGDPRRRGWRLAVETVDGRVHELGPRDVDPIAVDAAVRYYREVAQGHHRRDDIRWQG